jgi:exodeoxyribonuclease VII large subunit
MKTALDSRNPLAVLARGYCVAEKDGCVVKSAGTITPGDRMKIRFYTGSSQVIVEQVDHERDL